PDRSPPIHYAESSMKNGFGLKYIHTFLNFPFLLLQREALLQQLQVNAMDMESTLEELQLYKQTEEQDYYKYIDYLENKQKERENKLKAEAEARAAAENEANGSKENLSSSPTSPPQTNK
ncbi:rab-like protein 6, partial [Actinia tenebrosa]